MTPNELKALLETYADDNFSEVKYTFEDVPFNALTEPTDDEHLVVFSVRLGRSENLEIGSGGVGMRSGVFFGMVRSPAKEGREGSRIAGVIEGIFRKKLISDAAGKAQMAEAFTVNPPPKKGDKWTVHTVQIPFDAFIGE